MSDFEENIKKWVSIDNQLKKLNEHTRELRSQKTDVSKTILNYVETNELNKTTIQISDGQLRFANSKYTPPLTFKHVETCLERCLNNAENVKNIMDYIKNTRNISYDLDIKRSYME